MLHVKLYNALVPLKAYDFSTPEELTDWCAVNMKPDEVHAYTMKVEAQLAVLKKSTPASLSSWLLKGRHVGLCDPFTEVPKIYTTLGRLESTPKFDDSTSNYNFVPFDDSDIWYVGEENRESVNHLDIYFNPQHNMDQITWTAGDRVQKKHMEVKSEYRNRLGYLRKVLNVIASEGMAVVDWSKSGRKENYFHAEDIQTIMEKVLSGSTLYYKEREPFIVAGEPL